MVVVEECWKSDVDDMTFEKNTKPKDFLCYSDSIAFIYFSEDYQIYSAEEWSTQYIISKLSVF